MKRNRVERVTTSQIQGTIDRLNDEGWTLIGPAQIALINDRVGIVLLSFEKEVP